MVIGEDSCSRGPEFESDTRGPRFESSTLICFKICIVCLKRTKINEKEAENGPFKNAYRNKTYLPIIIGTYLPIIICTYLLKIIGTYLPIIIGTYLPSYL